MFVGYIDVVYAFIVFLLFLFYYSNIGMSKKLYF